VLTFAVAGLAAGGTFALLGLALTITFSATRTLNFAVSAIGTTGTFALGTAADAGLSFTLSLLLGMAVGALLGLGLGFVIDRWFSEARVETKSVLTIGVLVFLLAAGGLVWNGKSQPIPPGPLDPVVTVADVPVSQATGLVLGIAVLVAVVVSQVLSRTQIGRRLRAVSELPGTAELLGISARRYGLWVWSLSGAFSVLAIWLVASTYSTDFSSLALTVVPGLAAALLGLFKYLGWTVLGGLVLGMLQSVFAGSATFAQYSTTVPFFALLLILLWTQRGERWEDSR
jgi:branched-chain amino acid transport system permease protein